MAALSQQQYHQQSAPLVTASDQEAHTPLAVPRDDIAMEAPEELETGMSDFSFVASDCSVLLDRRSYWRLFVRHLLSLLPALSLVIALAFAAHHVPCELPLQNSTGEDTVARCDEALHTGLTLAASLIGGVAWLAAWSLRSASWLIASYFAAFPHVGYAEIDPIATSLVSIFIRTACIEALRLCSLAVGYGLFIAEATINPKVADHSLVPADVAFAATDEFAYSTMRLHDAFVLRARDPRFSIAIWVSFGWAVAETAIGCVQILQQLSLYASPLEVPLRSSSILPVVLAPANTLSPKPLRAPPRWPAPAGRQQRGGLDSSVDTVLRGSATGDGKAGKNDGAAALSLNLSCNEETGAIPASLPSPKLAPATEDPSAQLQHARDELARLTRRDIPQYGAADGAAASTSGAIATPAADQGTTHPCKAAAPAILVGNLIGDEAQSSHSAQLITSPVQAADTDGRTWKGEYEDEDEEEEAELPELDADEIEEERFEELLRRRQRDELEDTLGVPLPDVPVTLCLLWRVDGVLFNLGASLIIAAALARGQGPLHVRPLHSALTSSLQAPQHGDDAHSVPLLPELHTYATSVVVIFLVHSALSSIWQLSVPRFGFALVTYSSLIIALALVLIGLAQWGVLV
ncbi:hypothetical protein K437DRAFT_260283 [Tilletiaria anomala UBC 951]|uniref:Uncharacterized protein n=1 Tax=Tilletiaria anomala (strain ATCC 24038 / CBS 436.72 / UBC 951) TaxID=1037660 RepID=A0A066VBD5_TILAU|nr:uncharacterized protein K437DRAFT_260283 [Tilletiaria anomala UBC 951]KDN35855.1 hypothetical protein K437DRAFT_260283 [Tilletiaria anomala UBC 951]